MRGEEARQPSFVFLGPLEERIPKDHPLRAIRKMTDKALCGLSPLFDKIYCEAGRPSIPPEYLLRALLIQVLYAIPSERKLCEHLEYHLLFRWFVGLDLNEPVWHPTTFTQNRERLLEGEVAEAFFLEVRKQAQAGKLLSREHFSLDGTLVEAAASLKSFRPKQELAEGQEGGRGPGKDDPGAGEDPSPAEPVSESAGRDRNPSVDFHGERRRNDTHASTTDPEALLAKHSPGEAARLAYAGHLLTENRHGLIVQADLSRATGTAEREMGLELVKEERKKTKGRFTVAADKNYDTKDFVGELRTNVVTPHVARKEKYSAIDGRTTRWEGYALSQKKRKLVEEAFGWMKTVGLLHKLRHRGRAKARWIFQFTAAAYNLVRMRSLLPECIAR
ncbi:MAG: IS5 family transposase [Thermoleophilia bacterium]|nr:IS5 family transposase [Thermoleophilia bacterium]MCZ7663794.1 IS5 family transposase [Thermoleophilia bacterium]MCZ7664119.1 IS5 family transposase [Thermoleophilia bacterium]MCZ7665407.1 IS5 family transposase [Thermoleophilia bacterium]MCZ7665419.1 IS5 family transposase [Thermoleophilia bacterium]